MVTAGTAGAGPGAGTTVALDCLLLYIRGNSKLSQAAAFFYFSLVSVPKFHDVLFYCASLHCAALQFKSKAARPASSDGQVQG